MHTPKERIPLVQWIWRNYLKAALIPLILVELVFIIIYFITNHWSMQEAVDVLKQEANGNLTQLVQLESSSIHEQLSGITYLTEVYAKQTEKALTTEAKLSMNDAARLAYSQDGVYYTTTDQGGHAAVFYSGYVPVGEVEREKVARLLQTQDLMKHIQQSHPLIASIYFNTYDSLNIIYPYFDVIRQYPPRMNIPTYNFFYEADAQHNPERGVKWTDVYLDPAGHGWMMSCIAPVYREDFLEGVVGLDVTVSTIAERVLNLDIPWEGYGILVGEDGTILALPAGGEEDWGLSELTNDSYEEAILRDTLKPEQFNLYNREGLSVFSSELKGKTSGISTITLNEDTKIVSWNSISDTGWKLILIVSEKAIYESIDHMNVQLNYIGDLMIIGLVLFYLLFFGSLYRRARKLSLQISQPLLNINQMAHSIGEGAYHQQLPNFKVEELKETAQILIHMGQQLGDTYGALLATQESLRENEAYQQILIESLDDVIFEVDEEGTILNLRTNDSDQLAIAYSPDQKQTVMSILSEEDAKTFVPILKRVMETGNTETLEYQMNTPKGLRWFQLRISQIRSVKQKAVISLRDLTERVLMERAILDAKEEAEKASRAKSRFLSNMSHELRTPLNAVLGFAQLLTMDSKQPLSEAQAEFVQEIEKAGSHLLNLINEVLDLAKLEAGKATVSMEPVLVSTIMEETVSMIRPLAEQRGITIEHPDCGNGQLLIQADRIRLKQVLLNLLSNAVKYNKEQGKIDFFCEHIDRKLRFHVMDSGYGIPANELSQIFRPFYRASHQEAFVEGTGIGLAMVKELTDMMGGVISVESVEGQGSHFYVEFPLATSFPLPSSSITI